VSENAKVCSAHFDAADFQDLPYGLRILKTESVPSKCNEVVCYEEAPTTIISMTPVILIANNSDNSTSASAPTSTDQGVTMDHSYNIQVQQSPNTLRGLASFALEKAKQYQRSLYNANKRLKRSAMKVAELTEELKTLNLLSEQAKAAIEPFKGMKMKSNTKYLLLQIIIFNTFFV